MARFTLPRDIYHGKGALETLKTYKGKKAIICVGGGSMKRGGFLDRAQQYLEEAGMDKDTILVGTGLNFADSLSASATGLPVLLVKDELNSRQKEFLENNPGKNIIILGGTNAVNSTVEKQLKNYGDVDRIAGATRFETSLLIAERFFPDADTAVIAYSHDFPDGLCGGPLGYRLSGPVILTRPRNASSAKSFIKKNGISSAVVMGGMARLDDSVIKNIMSVSENYVVQYYYR